MIRMNPCHDTVNPPGTVYPNGRPARVVRVGTIGHVGGGKATLTAAILTALSAQQASAISPIKSSVV